MLPKPETQGKNSELRDFNLLWSPEVSAITQIHFFSQLVIKNENKIACQ
jgi:hypothetical protein